MSSNATKDTIQGSIENITFQNETNGYTVAQIQEVGKKDKTCIVGIMPSIQVGETLLCKGEWKCHSKHGWQFEITEYSVESPSNTLAIEKYLSSGLIKGIGPAFAKRIVRVFQKKTIEVIDQDPKKLLKVPGLGKVKLEQIMSSWKEQKSLRDIIISLQQIGITPTYAQKIYKIYGDDSLNQIKQNPYQLAKDIFGIGFKKADEIAKNMKIPLNSPFRIDAAIEFVLLELASTEGHTCYPLNGFIEKIQQMIQADKELIENRIVSLQQEKTIFLGDLYNEGKKTLFLWLNSLFFSEMGTAKEIRRLIKPEQALRTINLPKAIEWVEKILNISLEEKQKQAVMSSFTEKNHIITGGPGTGKSTITNAIIKIAEKLTSKILLAAPTGRAAKRLSEITGKKASTIHSILEFDPIRRSFKKSSYNPLVCDLIIIDEASMIDATLIHHLLKAIPNHTKVIFVGDTNQLPSVGPGNVLKDIIASNLIKTSYLQQIFRQAQGSKITTNAHKIQQGNFPDIHSTKGDDFFFFSMEDPEQILQSILSLVATRLPSKYPFDPLWDIQVLSPMKKGIIGIENLNIALQQKLNPQEEGIVKFGKKYSPNDKVIQLKNNHQKEIYNGDIGKIEKIDTKENKVFVQFDDKIVKYDFVDLDELTLAYAVSIHKYQGSESPCVIIPIHTTHFKLLNRNLLYTAITRGKKMVVLLGTTKALAIAVNNNEVRQRYTALLPILAQTTPSPLSIV